MLKIKTGLLAALLLVAFCACKKDSDSDPGKPVNDLNDAVAIGQPFTAPPADTTVDVGTTESEREENGRRLACLTTERRLTKRLLDFVNLSEATDLYPGAILQGASLREGQLTSIGDFPREAVRLTFTGLDFGAENVSRTVLPNLADVTSAIRDVTGGGARNIGLNSYEYRVSEAYSQEQALVSLGLSKSLAGVIGIGGSADFSETSQWSHVYVYFRQTYFTVSMENPANAAGLFAAGTNPADLAARIRPDNPAAYVKQVSYGRILAARISTRQREKQRSLRAAVNGLLSGALSGSGSWESSSLLRDCEYELKVYGGKAENLPQNLNGIRQFIEGGLAFDANTNALPVAFVANYLNDNSRFVRGDEATFRTTECRDMTETRSFEVSFDHFGIIKHCDSIDINDYGVFSYDISLYLRDSLIGQFSESELERGSNGRINLQQRFQVDNLFGEPGECLRVVVNLLEKDIIDDDEVLADNRAVSHCHPWAFSDLYTEERSNDGDLGYRVNFVQDPEDCEAYLFYRIREIR